MATARKEMERKTRESSATRRKRQSAHEADERTEFLDIAGHELRTPITALKGHAQLLQRRLRRQGDREADLNDLNKMMYQIERLNFALDLYIGASHIAQGHYEITLAPCDLVATARKLVELFAAGGGTRIIRLETADDTLLGNWDRRRIEQTLAALLSNALKYGLSGDVIVRVRREDGVARVETLDSGPGVPAAERYRVFDAYVTGSNVENPGVGLSLYVAREAVRRQGGRIGVRARSGGGSVFWFALPIGEREQAGE